MTNSKRIRPGLYELGQYRIEDYHSESGWVWRLTDTENYSDAWMGDFRTKREALEVVANLIAVDEAPADRMTDAQAEALYKEYGVS